MISGYLRPDGKVGIRNHVLVLSSVGCANHVVKRIADQVAGTVGLPNVKGCGQIGQGIELMKKCLVNIALNPNVYGTLIVGLGCESTKPHDLAKAIAGKTEKPVDVITIQEEGDTLKTIQRGSEIARAMVAEAALVPRVPVDPSVITLATECGGSDATSGLAANPVIGACSDRLVANGGSVIISETTELIGTEHILARRAKDDDVKSKLYAIIGDLEQQFIAGGIDVRGANPTPGNMKGGLSTLEEKALGGISKGGTSTINEVVGYGDMPTEHGLIVMDTPGYDIESISGMVAGGAQICAFSSGRGNPVGNPLIPVIKVTGNKETAASMRENIDLDTSGVVEGTATIDQLGGKLYSMLEDVCNGVPTKAEALGFDDFALYHNQEVWCTCDLR